MKTSRCRAENQQTQPTYDAGSVFEPGPQWWEASALTAAPSLHPMTSTKTTTRCAKMKNARVKRAKLLICKLVNSSCLLKLPIAPQWETY